MSCTVCFGSLTYKSKQAGTSPKSNFKVYLYTHINTQIHTYTHTHTLTSALSQLNTNNTSVPSHSKQIITKGTLYNQRLINTFAVEVQTLHKMQTNMETEISLHFAVIIFLFTPDESEELSYLPVYFSRWQGEGGCSLSVCLQKERKAEREREREREGERERGSGSVLPG